MTNQEINEAVGLRLGWSRYNYDPASLDKVKRIPCYSAPNGDLYAAVPNYSGSIQAAWEILTHCYADLDCGYSLMFNRCTLQAHCCIRDSEGVADTMPMAICLAFLKLAEAS